MCEVNCDTKSIPEILEELRSIPIAGSNISYLPRGDAKIPFIKWQTVASIFDYVCCRWQWSVLEVSENDGGWHVKGRLTVVSADGESLSRESVGHATLWDAQNSLSYANKQLLASVSLTPEILMQFSTPPPMEVAERAAFKRCASWFGVYPNRE